MRKGLITIDHDTFRTKSQLRNYSGGIGVVTSKYAKSPPARKEPHVCNCPRCPANQGEPE